MTTLVDNFIFIQKNESTEPFSTNFVITYTDANFNSVIHI